MTAPPETRTASRGTRTGQDRKAKETRKVNRSASQAEPRSTSRTGAYARREDRRVRDSPERPKQRSVDRQPRVARARKAAKPLQAKVASTRFPMVVTTMSILGVGLVATLWLSIAAVSGSYELQQGEQRINSLTEQRDRLIRSNSSKDSTPALQRRATEEGLVPGPDPARLVRTPEGEVRVVGEPKPAEQPPREPHHGRAPVMEER